MSAMRKEREWTGKETGEGILREIMDIARINHVASLWATPKGPCLDRSRAYGDSQYATMLQGWIMEGEWAGQGVQEEAIVLGQFRATKAPVRGQQTLIAHS